MRPIMPNIPGELVQSAKNIVAPAGEQGGKMLPSKVIDGASSMLWKTVVTEPSRLFLKLGLEPSARLVTRTAIQGAKFALRATAGAIVSIPGVPVWMRKSVGQGRLTLDSTVDAPPSSPIPGTDGPWRGTGA